MYANQLGATQSSSLSIKVLSNTWEALWVKQPLVIIVAAKTSISEVECWAENFDPSYFGERTYSAISTASGYIYESKAGVEFFFQQLFHFAEKRLIGWMMPM